MRLVTLILTLAIVTPALAQTAQDTAPDIAPVPPVPVAPLPAPPKAQDQVPAATRESLALPPPPRGRFSFAPVDEGFLRFDHKSGDVALCKSQNGSWSCDAVPGSGVAQQQDQTEQKEIAELRKQVSALQQDVASLRAPPPPPPHPVPPQTVPPAPDDQTGSITLKQDIARARGYLADAWRRLVDMIDNLQKDMRRNGNDDGTSRT
jgi:hypothetical protein